MNTSMSPAVPPGAVLVGVDGSAHGEAALAWAVDHAAARRAPLVVVHGSAPLGVGRIPFADEGRLMLRESTQRVVDHAVELVHHADPELPVSVLRRYEDPRSTLLEAAEGAAMVVLGTRGLGRLRSLLLGSVSQAVASHAACPVTVVRPAELQPGPGRGNVVVGVELDGSSEAALEEAFAIAEDTRRPLDVVHVRPGHDALADPDGYVQRLDVSDRHERGFAETVLRHAEKHPHVTVVHRTVEGAPVAILVEASRTAGHLVVGSRGRHGVPALLGSVSRTVLERAHCAVTVVREPAPQAAPHERGEARG